ncbi:MAG: hypothetical protein DSY70_06870 [Desulfobulbus sp.]|nr:MAG: hypothetical protein DSY70_06870 [Desulfobulbus sp.]
MVCCGFETNQRGAVDISCLLQVEFIGLRGWQECVVGFVCASHTKEGVNSCPPPRLQDDTLER